ncbi:Sds3-like protein [Lipomyces tetrasporus]|uniref:Sds3-like protein n=1 Tax=Lipomyces tetrasporus TaxID=54092 RepID=A0AAD7QSC0_9ASCO|nr:Sds3-like protein [Lipomyces tetrasporus]KAJ8100514.1 Sds3-like protein [Lipomyces tetrasporus]
MTTAATTTTASKRDKRRHNLVERYTHLTNAFASQKDAIYRDTLADLQTRLAALHAGTDPAFVDRLTDVEEQRDAELVALYLNEQFLVARADREYERDVAAAEEEYAAKAKSVRERLLARLESQRRRLREDKELLDIANDHSLLLNVSGYQTAPGSPSSGGSGMMGSVGERRKNLRRRGEIVPSAVVENGAKKRKRVGTGGTGPGGGGGGKAGERDEIAAFWSDREALPFGHHRDDGISGGTVTASGRHREKPFGGMTGLKSEEANEDLAVLRKKKKKK